MAPIRSCQDVVVCLRAIPDFETDDADREDMLLRRIHCRTLLQANLHSQSIVSRDLATSGGAPRTTQSRVTETAGNRGADMTRASQLGQKLQEARNVGCFQFYAGQCDRSAADCNWSHRPCSSAREFDTSIARMRRRGLTPVEANMGPRPPSVDGSFDEDSDGTSPTGSAPAIKHVGHRKKGRS